jgi:hypothetical protein
LMDEYGVVRSEVLRFKIRELGVGVFSSVVS